MFRITVGKSDRALRPSGQLCQTGCSRPLPMPACYHVWTLAVTAWLRSKRIVWRCARSGIACAAPMWPELLAKPVLLCCVSRWFCQGPLLRVSHTPRSIRLACNVADKRRVSPGVDSRLQLYCQRHFCPVQICELHISITAFMWFLIWGGIVGSEP